jgi:hypothetical protein
MLKKLVIIIINYCFYYYYYCFCCCLFNLKCVLNFFSFIINKMLHKSSGLSYIQVRERYEHFRSRCTQTRKHKGCTKPLFGEKSKCILKIVPQSNTCETFHVDKRCIKHDLSHTSGGTPPLDNV